MADQSHPDDIDEWLEFSEQPDGDGPRPTLRHPVVYVAVVIGILIAVGLVALRPTGETRAGAEAQRSVLGFPTDFFDGEVSTALIGPCDFLPEVDCATISFLIEEGPHEGQIYTQVFSTGETTPKFEVGQGVMLSYREPNGRVTAVSDEPCEWDQEYTCSMVTAVVTRGDLFGREVTVEVASEFDDFRIGEDVDITFDEDALAIAVAATSLESQYQFSDFDRRFVLLVVLFVFCAAVVVLGRWRGVAALAGLGLSLAIVIGWLLPAILDGRNPAWVAFIGGSAVAFVALYVSHGVSLMTSSALIGTIAALGLTSVLSRLTIIAADFTGLASEESTLLTLYSGLDIRGLLLAGMVLGAAGALDDVTVTQAESVWQLRRANRDATEADLRSAAMSIGRHHIGSTVNTLLLAYLGASLPLAVLFVIAGQSFGTIVNSEVVAVEIVRTLVGSLGLIAAVPITTWLAARIAASGRGDVRLGHSHTR